jgi:hypothetical protein
MKTALPAPAEYYRLTRARELRKKAARLNTWRLQCGHILHAGGAVAWLVLPLTLLPGTGTPSDPQGLLALLAYCVVSYGCYSLALAPLWLASLRLLTSRLEKLEREAEALEREHRARYGALPAGTE